MNLPFFIAKRYLVSKKSTNAINIISGISVTGICVGTMALVIVLSAFNGLSGLVETLYGSFDPDLRITAKQGKTFVPDSETFASLKKMPGIAHYTEVVEGNALLKYDKQQCVATIKGVSDEFEQMSGFDTLVEEGSFNIRKNNMVLGKGISYILQSRTSDLSSLISVYAPKRGTISSLNPDDALNELKMYPAGVFSINDEFNNQYVLTNIEKARELLDYTNEVTSVELGIAKTADREAVQKQVRSLLGDSFEVKNKAQQNVLLFQTMESEKFWCFMILVFILIVATFNVIGTLTMLIIEKKKDIIILRNLGADLKLIRRIFLFEGLMITLIGAVAGFILGLLICWIQIRYKLIGFSENLVVDSFPIKIQAADLVAIVFAVMLIGALAAWYPVRLFTKKQVLQ
ncbi:MAG: FtsX-like permease family protein [Bacteroidia bacterium]